MKYLIATCLLALPIAMSAAPTPAEAGYRDGHRDGHRDGYRCHIVKKTTWNHGKKRTRWVKVCKLRHHR